jgi:hypothetical protein
MSIARTTPAQKPLGFKSRTRFVEFAVSFWPTLGESKVIVVTSPVYLVLPGHDTRRVTVQVRSSPMCDTTCPQRAGHRSRDRGRLQPAGSQATKTCPARRRQLTQPSCLVVAAMMAAMASQGGHTLRVLAVSRTEFLPCGCHTRTRHVGAFCRCIRHAILLKSAAAPASRSAHILLVRTVLWHSRIRGLQVKNRFARPGMSSRTKLGWQLKQTRISL